MNNEALKPDEASESAPRRLRGERSVNRFALSPDGRRAATTGAGKVELWEIASGDLLYSGYPLRTEYNSNVIPAFSPVGDELIAGEILLNSQTFEVIAGDQIEGFNSLFSPDGSVVACWNWFVDEGACGIRLIRNQLPQSSWEQNEIWNFRTNLAEPFEHGPVEDVWGVPTHLGLRLIANVAFSPDGGQLAFSTLFGTVGVIDATSGRLLWEVHTSSRSLIGVRNHPDFPTAAPVAVSPDGKTVAHGLGIERALSYEIDLVYPRSVEIRSLETGELLRELRIEPLYGTAGTIHTHFTGVSFSPNGRFLATSHPVQIWDVATWEVVWSPYYGNGPFGQIAFTADGRRLVSSENDLVVWDLPSQFYEDELA